MSRRIFDLPRERAGMAALEFALTVPALLIIMLGATQFGLTFNNYLMLTNATQAGTRQFALSRGSNTLAADAVNMVYGSAPNLSPANLTIILKVGVTQCASVPPLTSAANAACKTAMDSAQGQAATLTSTYPCTLRIYGHDYLPHCTLTAQTTERIE
jgi:Flp pilus assembly protein TadG